MKKLALYSISILFIGAAISFSCEGKEKTKEKKSSEKKIEIKASSDLVIEAESFTEASEGVKIETSESGEKFISSASEGWIALDVNVLSAGRYTSGISAFTELNSVNCWIEDYVDNTDGRTYNITGNIVFPAEQNFSLKSVDGSPLNKGLHKMKVHFSGKVNIDKIKFVFIKAHDITPEFLTQNMEGKEWQVVWSDEFEGEEIDTTKWTYDIGNWGWGNFEAQYYTVNRKENARVENGNLIIEARKNDMGQEWTSARITTRGKTSFTYGRIEMKAMVPPNKGNWAAGWTLGDDYVDEKSWPYCGEIDIMESVGYEMDDETGNGIAHASVHCKAYYFKIGNQKTFLQNVEKMNTEYHTYTVEWSPEKIIGFVDNNEYFYYNNDGTEDGWPFDKPQNLILNLAMGGGWGGAQGMDESVTSQKMIVDYVRVYELK